MTEESAIEKAVAQVVAHTAVSEQEAREAIEAILAAYSADDTPT